MCVFVCVCEKKISILCRFSLVTRICIYFYTLVDKLSSNEKKRKKKQQTKKLTSSVRKDPLTINLNTRRYTRIFVYILSLNTNGRYFSSIALQTPSCSFHTILGFEFVLLYNFVLESPRYVQCRIDADYSSSRIKFVYSKILCERQTHR